jgi:hypothetical protein
VTHAPAKFTNNPCSDGVIHSYISPEVAAFCNPIHGNYDNPRFWDAEGDVTGCDGLKTWGPSLTTITEIPAVEITTEHRVEIAIRIALMTRREPGFISWAEKWLSGEDRTAGSAYAAARSVAESAAYAARSADSAYAAARSVAYAEARSVAESAAYAARSVAESARSVANKRAFNIGLHMLICSVIYK